MDSALDNLQRLICHKNNQSVMLILFENIPTKTGYSGKKLTYFNKFHMICSSQQPKICKQTSIQAYSTLI